MEECHFRKLSNRVPKPRKSISEPILHTADSFSHLPVRLAQYRRNSSVVSYSEILKTLLPLPDGCRNYIVGGQAIGRLSLGHTFHSETLEEATKICSDGDHIYVLPGCYKEEIRISKKNVKIIGVGEQTSVLLLGVVISTSLSATIQNLTLKNGLSIESGELTIRNCTLSGPQCALSAHPNSQPLVKDCIIEEFGIAGVYCYPHSNAILERVNIDGKDKTGSVGIYVDSCSPRVNRCTMENVETGILIRGSSSAPFVSHCEISKVTGVGFYMYNNTSAIIRSNIIRTCNVHGLLIDNASPTVDQNTIHDCSVVVRGNSKATLRRNYITGKIIDETQPKL